MHTLKVQLGLTLSALLFTSMLLFGFVILILWQRSVLTQETILSEQLLQMAAIVISTNDHNTSSTKFSEQISKYMQKNDILCLQWGKDTSSTKNTFGSCPTSLTLSSILETAKTTKKQETAYSGVLWNGFFLTKRHLLMAIPLQHSNEEFEAIALIRSMKNVVTPIRNTQKIFFAYLLINIIIFTTIGFTRLIHLVLKPIRRLTALADSRTTNDESSFFQGERLGEFTQLSLSLNRLVTRIDGDKQELRATVSSLKLANEELQRNRDEMIRAEKLASIGRLSAGLAHEIGNPLGIIQGYIDLLAEDSLNVEDRETFAQRSIQELNRINTLIRNLLDLSRSPIASVVTTIDVHTILEELLKSIRMRKTVLPIDFSTRFDAESSLITVDSEGLRQVFLNCLLNSIDAIEESNSIEQGNIVLSTTNTNTKNCIIITLMDNGTGILPEHTETIFDPFFTTKEVGKGTGLGLAVAHNLIQKSGGQINLSSADNTGTVVTITLPLADMDSQTPLQEPGT